ncbi:unnamed protein product [Haemonchus placei]|uniref:Uncharacterized protein n=1 Tax=Haemonchus placei TaxID=6290 RepID=A0A3P8CUK7_HAEPC|nr:unnamed protein product [Haemonchus placei]
MIIKYESGDRNSRDFFSPSKGSQFDHYECFRHGSFCFLNQINSCLQGSTCCQQIIYYYDLPTN